MSILSNLVAQGKVTDYADYRAALLTSRVKKIIPTITGGSWGNTKLGKGLATTRASRTGLSYAAVSSASSGILVFLARRLEFSATGVCEFVGGNSSSYAPSAIFYQNNFGIWDYSASTFRSSGASTTDDKVHVYAVRWASGVANGTKFYKDGQLLATVTWTAGGTNPDISVGYGADIDMSSGGTTLAWALLDNVSVDDATLLGLMSELLRTPGAGEPKCEGFVYPVPSPEDSVVFYGGHAAGEVMPDLSGHGYAGIATAMTRDRGNVLEAMRHGQSSVYGTSATIAEMGASEMTFEVLFKPNGTPSSWAYLVNLGSRGGIFLQGGAMYIRFGINGLSTLDTGVVYQNDMIHLVYTWKSGEKQTVYLNGQSVAQSTNVESASLAAVTSFATGLYSGGTYPIHSVYFMGLRNYRMTAAQVAARHAKIAGLCRFTSSSGRSCPSLVNQMAGSALSNTPYRVFSGTWKVSEDTSGRKWLQAVSAGSLSRRARGAFGTWVYRFNFPSLASETSFGFVASASGPYSAYQGYCTYIWPDASFGVLRCNGGGSAAIIQTSAGALTAGTEYLAAVTRDPMGIFKLYLKPVASGTWTLLGTSTASTAYATPNLHTIYLSVGGDKITDIRHYQGVLDASTLPND